MWLSGPFISACVPIVCKDSELLVISPKLGWFRNRNPWKYFIFKVRQCHSSRRDCLFLFLPKHFPRVDRRWPFNRHVMSQMEFSLPYPVFYFCDGRSLQFRKVICYRLYVPSAGSQLSEVQYFFPFFLKQEIDLSGLTKIVITMLGFFSNVQRCQKFDL